MVDILGFHIVDYSKRVSSVLNQEARVGAHFGAEGPKCTPQNSMLNKSLKWKNKNVDFQLSLAFIYGMISLWHLLVILSIF